MTQSERDPIAFTREDAEWLQGQDFNRHSFPEVVAIMIEWGLLRLVPRAVKPLHRMLRRALPLVEKAADDTCEEDYPASLAWTELAEEIRRILEGGES